MSGKTVADNPNIQQRYKS